jgi:hypothetical protein
LSAAKLSVIFYIILCLEIGIFLTLAPWWPDGMFGIRDWGSNYFLLYAARKTGIQGLQAVVASGWVRGAVSGIGLLNIGIGFWEIFNFKRTVAALQSEMSARTSSNNAAEASTSDRLSDNERRDDVPTNS